jgi:Glyoxalase/Bleomycin resistance protein/Dioxygenase superfamily
MVQTHGLTHINLAVRDLGRALRFYEQVFGLREYGREMDSFILRLPAGTTSSPLSRTPPPPVSVGASHISAFGSWTPTTSTVPSPRSNAPEGDCSVVASSLPASLTPTWPIRMATKLRSGSNEPPLPPNQSLQLSLAGRDDID